MFSYSQVRSPTDEYHVSSPIAIQKAIGCFNTAIWRGRLYRLWLSLQHQQTTLFDLTRIANQCKMINCHSLGCTSISIHEIKGSEGRCLDFDKAIFPIRSHIKDRWVWIAALILMGIVYIAANVTAWEVSGALPWEH